MWWLQTSSPLFIFSGRVSFTRAGFRSCGQYQWQHRVISVAHERCFHSARRFAVSPSLMGDTKRQFSPTEKGQGRLKTQQHDHEPLLCARENWRSTARAPQNVFPFDLLYFLSSVQYIDIQYLNYSFIWSLQRYRLGRKASRNLRILIFFQIFFSVENRADFSSFDCLNSCHLNCSFSQFSTTIN